MSLIIEIFKKGVKKPTLTYKGDAGLDIYAPKSGEIAPHSFDEIKTGLSIEIPEGYYGKLESRSSLSKEFGLLFSGGVIDAGYTGEISIVICNMSKKVFKYEKGDKIAQLVIVKIFEYPSSIEVLKEGKRNEKGFGSSGR